MKTVQNLSFTIKTVPTSPNTATTVSLLELVLAQPPQTGFDFATMRARNRVADVLAKVAPGAGIELEDADYATAVQCVKDYRWGATHPDLLKFAEQFGL